MAYTHEVWDQSTITQANVDDAYRQIFAPWVKQLGLHDFVVREGFVSASFHNDTKLNFMAGPVCGQAIMAAVDTVLALAMSTSDRSPKGTAYQHTQFLRPAVAGSFLVEAQIKRFGGNSAYGEANVYAMPEKELIAHGVAEFAF